MTCSLLIYLAQQCWHLMCLIKLRILSLNFSTPQTEGSVCLSLVYTNTFPFQISKQHKFRKFSHPSAEERAMFLHLVRSFFENLLRSPWNNSSHIVRKSLFVEFSNRDDFKDNKTALRLVLPQISDRHFLRSKLTNFAQTP